MDTTYFSIAEITGLKLAPETTYIFNHHIITNSPTYIFENIANFEQLMQYLGKTAAGFIMGHSFLINKFNVKDDADFSYNNNYITQLLTQLWLITDNCVSVQQFVFVPAENQNIEYRHAINAFQFYKSDGSVTTESYSTQDFESMEINLDLSSKLISHNRIERKYEDLNMYKIQLAHRTLAYNDATRVERGLQFLFTARTQSSPIIKIANYIMSLECLFSFSSDYIKRNVSNRVSNFINSQAPMMKKSDVRDLVRNCYTIRSNYVHGNKLLPKHQDLVDLEKYSVEIDNICRILFKSIISKQLSIFNEDDNKLLQYFSTL